MRLSLWICLFVTCCPLFILSQSDQINNVGAQRFQPINTDILFSQVYAKAAFPVTTGTTTQTGNVATMITGYSVSNGGGTNLTVWQFDTSALT